MFAVKVRALSRRRALLATTAATVIAGFGTVAHAATPIDTAQPFYNQSDVGTTVNPDFQGGTLRDNVNAVTDNNTYNVENFPTNTIDEFGNTVTFTGAFSGAGPLTFADSVGGGNAIFTGTSVLGGAVTVNSSATLTWGNGTGGAFLIGPGNAVVDNGSLVMDFGGASGVIGDVPISGTGSVTVHTGLFEELGPSTYTGGTTIDAAGTLTLGNGGSTVGTLAGPITDNGVLKFDYAGAAPITAANTITGGGSAEAVSGTVVITGSGAITGTVTIDGGATMQWGAGGPAFLVGAGNSVIDNGALTMNFGGGGIAGSIPISGSGTLEVISGSLNDSGASTFTGTTTIDAAGFLALNGAGSIANSSDIIDNGIFDISGTTAGASVTTLEGGGGVSLGAQTLTLTNASGTFSGVLADGGLFGGVGGGLTIGGGTETLTGTNTYTGGTTIDLGATLVLGNGGTTGTVAGNIFDNGLLQFNYGGVVTPLGGGITGTGSVEEVAGTVVLTGTSVLTGNVTIDPGATMQWGAGGPGFLVGAGNSVIDNGALTMNFGGGGIAGSIPISGSGTLEVISGSLNDSGASTFTGTATIDAAGFLALTGAGSMSNSSDIIDNGIFDISGTTAGASVTTLEGGGGVSLGAQTLTLTNASGTFSGVLADGGLFGGVGGGLTIGGGTETLTGTNTYTGATTIDLGATLALGNGGPSGTVAGNIVDNGLVQFNYGGSPVTAPNAFSGAGSVEAVAGTVIVTNTSFVGGNVTIDPGATMEWGAGGPAFLVGPGNSVVDNGALTMNFGGGGIAGSIPISGSGALEIISGSLNDSGASTFTGITTIDPAGVLALTGAGSIANSSDVIDSGIFDISGTAAGASITSLDGDGGVSLGGQLLTLTNASGTFGGVIADGGLFGGTGGQLTIAGGTETLTGVNTFTGLTTVNDGATLDLVGAGSIALSDPLVNGTFDISGAAPPGSSIISLSGHGHVILGANTLTLTNAADLFSGFISGTGGLTIGAGIEALSGVNTFTGTTLIDPGATLQLGDGAGNMGLLAGPITDNGALLFNGGAATDSIFATSINGAGTAEVVSGILGLTGTNTYAGPTQVDVGATLQLGEGGTTGTVEGLIVDNGLVQFNYAGPVTSPNGFTGTGSVEVVAGTVVYTGSGSAVGGAVTIDPGATLQWGNGGPTFLIGGAGGVVDNGALVLNFGGGGVGGTIPISGTGTFELVSGSLNNLGVSTYTGTTTIDPAGFLLLSGAGSISDSSDVIDNGLFDISGTTAPGTSIITLEGSGGASLGAQTLTLTNASGTFSGVLADGGLSGGVGGGLTIAAGTETLTGTNTFTGNTTVDLGATLILGAGGTTGTVAGNVVDNGLVQFVYGGPVTTPNTFTGGGAAEVVSGTVVITGASALGGNVTIDPGATMQWGAGNPAFLIGGTGVVDNGALVMDFGGGGVGTSAVFSGTGTVELESGSFNTAGVNTYTGTTTIDPGALFLLSGGGSISDSSNVIDNGTLDISGEPAGTAIITLTGSGGVSLGARTLTLTNASGTFSGVMADGGIAGGVGGGLTIAAGTETLTGTNTYTGLTTIGAGATLKLGAGGTTGTVAGNVVDNGLVQFNYSGPVTSSGNFSGSGSAELVAGTLVVTGEGGVGGTVTIDPGSTMQWGNGTTVGFLVGGSGAVVDNGALVTDFGSAGGASGSVPISGTGTLTLESGAFTDSGVSTYTGATTIEPGAAFRLSGAGSISDSSGVADAGVLDISGTTAPGTSITTLTGGGDVFLGARTLTLTAASGTFSGVLADGGVSGGTGGGFTIAAGTETLTGTNTFTGLTTVASGAVLNLGAGGTSGSVAGNILDNGTLNLNRSNLLVIGQSISGTGALNQVGTGFTILDGFNPFTGLTTISAGTLEVGDGAHPGATLGGNVVVGANGRLEGHGTIAGSVSNIAGGVVAPGGTIGTLTVGSYTQGPTSTLAIEVAPTVASQLNSLGAASLNGHLALTFDPGTYTDHIYDILNGHPVTGTFSTVTAAGSVGAGNVFGIFYTPTQVDLVTEATSHAQIYGGVSAATLDRAQNFATLVEDRFGDAGCPDGSADKSAPGCHGFGAWAYVIGSWNNQSTDGSAFGFRNEGVGVVGGLDRSTDNGSLVGLSFGYTHNDLTMAAADGKASGPSYYGAVYGRLVDRGMWFDGQVFYMHTDWSVDRVMPGLGVATSNPNTDSEGFLLQASLPIGDTGLRPYARFTYVLSDRGGVLENGVGPLGYQINPNTQSAAVGEVGILYSPTFTTGGGLEVRPALKLGVQDNAGDRGQTVTGSLFGITSTAFQQVGPRLWGVAGVVDGSLKVRVNQSLELFGDINGRFGDHQTDGVASVGGVIRF
jgi:fibronectin-binding autotransporter adhesin